MWLLRLILIGWSVLIALDCQGELPVGRTDSPITLKVGLADVLKDSSNGEEPSGVFVETIEAIASNLNLRLEWVELKEDALNEGLRTGGLDVLLGVPSETITGGGIQLSQETLLRDWGQIYVQPGMAKRVRRLPDIAGLRLGYIAGDVHWPVLNALISLYQIPVETVAFSARNELITAMEGGTIDLMATGRLDAQMVKNAFKKLKATPIHYNDRSLQIGYGVGLNPGLRDLIEQELYILLHTPESAYFRAIDEWWGLEGNSDPYENGEENELGWRWLGLNPMELILVFLLLLILLWLRETQLRLKHLKWDYQDALELEEKLRKELKKVRERDRKASTDSASL